LGVLLTCVITVHDSSVVEHDIQTAPRVNMLDSGLNVGLLGNVTLHGLDGAGHVRDYLLCLGDGFGKRGLGNVAHQD